MGEIALRQGWRWRRDRVEEAVSEAGGTGESRSTAAKPACPWRSTGRLDQDFSMSFI